MTNRFHTLHDAIGRPHYFFGTDAEAKKAGKGYSAIGIGAADQLAEYAAIGLCSTSDNDLFAIARELEDDRDDKGFLQGNYLVAMTAAAAAPEFEFFRPDFENFRKEYRNWVSKHVGMCISSSKEGNDRFDAIVAAVLRKTKHPAYAAAVVEHKKKWVTPNGYGYQAWCNSHP